MLVQLWDFICYFSSFSGRSDAKALKNQEITETTLNNFK